VKKLEQLEYSLESVTDLSSSSVSSSSPAVATFSYVDGVTELRFLQSDSTHCFNFDLASAQVNVDSHAYVTVPLVLIGFDYFFPSRLKRLFLLHEDDETLLFFCN